MALALVPGGRSLAIAGAALFLAGLVQGAAVDLFANPRMALSAHLDAVQSGMAVMIAAAFWGNARWGALTERAARWTLAAGMVGLWLGITLSAATGASDALPMAGEGYSAVPAVEAAVTAIILTSSIALTVGWVLFLIGLVRGR